MTSEGFEVLSRTSWKYLALYMIRDFGIIELCKVLIAVQNFSNSDIVVSNIVYIHASLDFHEILFHCEERKNVSYLQATCSRLKHFYVQYVYKI